MGEVRDRKMLVFSLFAGSAAVMEVALLPTAVPEDSPLASSSGTGVLSVDGMRWTR